MTQAAKSPEPSMEEILASIRRIIADDDASKTTQRGAEPAKPPSPEAPLPPEVIPPEPIAPQSHAEPPAALPAARLEVPEDQSSDILDLTESMTAAPPDPAASLSMPQQFRKIDGYADVDFGEAVETPAVASTAEAVRRHGEELLSRETSAAVDNAFNTLAQTVLVQNARTLEDLVREMLRPMLKTWLDDNLPGMVERLVRAEIERVSRGR